MVSLISIVKYFATRETLIERGEKAVKVLDVQSIYYDPDKQEIDASVNSSWKDKTYLVKVYLDESGIKGSECTCPIGKVQCHHIAAPCIYALNNVSVTDKPCRWNIPKQPQKMKSCEELFGSDNKKCLTKPITKENLNFLYSKLQEHAPTSGLAWFMSPEPDSVPEISKPTVEDIITSLHSINIADKIAECFLKMSVNSLEINEIFLATTGQRNNPLWGIYREGRLTSSNFGLILKAVSKNNIPPSLLKNLNGEYSLENVKAVQWGICHEATALELFEEVKDTKVVSGGLYLHFSGLLACSPDGLVDDDLLEIKCPFSKTGSDILKEIHTKKWYIKYNKDIFTCNLYNSGDISVYDFKNGDLSFNLQHPLGWKYFIQVQGMLHIMNKKICHVMIWTPNISIIFQVEKDSSWKCNLEKLLNFYETVFVCNILK